MDRDRRQVKEVNKDHPDEQDNTNHHYDRQMREEIPNGKRQQEGKRCRGRQRKDHKRPYALMQAAEKRKDHRLHRRISPKEPFDPGRIPASIPPVLPLFVY
jgi:hypothetical protein